MSDITDLDVLVPPARKVLLKGKTYTLPGDMPLETYLKVNLLGDRQSDGVQVSDLVTEMVSALVDLFTREPQTPAPDVEELRRIFLGLGFETVTQFLGKIYPIDDAGDGVVDAAAAGPQMQTAGPTTTTT